MATNRNDLEGDFFIFRGPNDANKPPYTGDPDDEGAYLQFSDWVNYVGVKFGYTAPSGKEYKRSISLDLSDVIALRNYLSRYIIAKASEEKKFRFISFDAYMDINLIKKDIPSVKKIDNYNLKGYDIAFETKEGYNLPFSKVFTDVGSSIYGVLYEIDLLEKTNYLNLINLSKRIPFYSSENLEGIYEKTDYEGNLVFCSYQNRFTSAVPLSNVSNEHMQIVIEAAISNNLPQSYIEKLKEIPTMKD